MCFFKIDHCGHLFIYFRLFNSVDSKQINVHIKVCQCYPFKLGKYFITNYKVYEIELKLSKVLKKLIPLWKRPMKPDDAVTSRNHGIYRTWVTYTTVFWTCVLWKKIGNNVENLGRPQIVHNEDSIYTIRQIVGSDIFVIFNYLILCSQSTLGSKIEKRLVLT